MRRFALGWFLVFHGLAHAAAGTAAQDAPAGPALALASGFRLAIATFLFAVDVSRSMRSG